MLIRPEGADRTPVALVSHDLAVELLAGSDEEHRLVAGVAGSLDSLIGVRQGLADMAGCHLLDVDTGQYNIPYARHLFPDRDVVVVTLAHREQGLIVAPGNPLTLHGVSDIAERRARFVNRNRGSGTRLWLEHALSESGVCPDELIGYDDVVETHTEAASRVASCEADAAVGIAAAAESYGLGFVPLFRERYDLVIPEDVYRTEQVERLVDRLHTRVFRRMVAGLSGYDPTSMGDEYRLAV
jgi:putative molybdopterin biosynthesis protein